MGFEQADFELLLVDFISALRFQSGLSDVFGCKWGVC